MLNVGWPATTRCRLMSIVAETDRDQGFAHGE